MMWTWSLPGRQLGLGERTHIMGIVNVTPDSFSDGGRWNSADRARDRAIELAAAGADVIDIGGESSRPGAAAVSPAEECARVLPAIRLMRNAALSTRHASMGGSMGRAMAPALAVPISIDTRNAEVAERALEAGAEIVNDISALRHDPDMARVVAERGAGVVLMHMQGSPTTMQHEPRYRDVVDDVVAFFEERLAAASSAGIAESAIVLDPGIGFGKTLEHNIALLARSDEILRLGRPILIGASRKSMFGDLLGLDVADRAVPTAASVALSAFLGAALVRVHDVRECRWAAAIGDAARVARRHSSAGRPHAVGAQMETT